MAVGKVNHMRPDLDRGTAAAAELGCCSSHPKDPGFRTRQDWRAVPGKVAGVATQTDPAEVHWSAEARMKALQMDLVVQPAKVACCYQNVFHRVHKQIWVREYMDEFTIYIENQESFPGIQE